MIKFSIVPVPHAVSTTAHRPAGRARSGVIAAAVLLWGLSTMAASAMATTYTVGINNYNGQACDYASVQAAIDAIPDSYGPDDHVQLLVLGSSIQNGRLRINKNASISIIGGHVFDHEVGHFNCTPDHLLPWGGHTTFRNTGGATGNAVIRISGGSFMDPHRQVTLRNIRIDTNTPIAPKSAGIEIAGFYAPMTVRLENTVIENLTATNIGGGISLLGGRRGTGPGARLPERTTLILDGVTIRNNRAVGPYQEGYAGLGGGLYCDGYHNQANDERSAHVEVVSAEFLDNRAGSLGGGLYIGEGCVLTRKAESPNDIFRVHGNEIAPPAAAPVGLMRGGGIAIENGGQFFAIGLPDHAPLEVTENRIPQQCDRASNPSAWLDAGAGLYLDGADSRAIIAHAEIQGNEIAANWTSDCHAAYREGGGLAIFRGSLELSDARVERNRVVGVRYKPSLLTCWHYGGAGGGLVASIGADVVVERTWFDSNRAERHDNAVTCNDDAGENRLSTLRVARGSQLQAVGSGTRVMVANSAFLADFAASNGSHNSAIDIGDTASLRLVDSTFYRNKRTWPPDHTSREPAATIVARGSASVETAGVVFNECGPNTASCAHNIPAADRGEHEGVTWRARCLALPNPSAAAGIFTDNDPSTHIALDRHRDLDDVIRPKAGSLLIDACAGSHWVRPDGGLQDIPRLLTDLDGNPRPISYSASPDTPLDIGAFEFIQGGAPGVAMAVADMAANFEVSGALSAGVPVGFHLGGSIVHNWTPERTPALYRKTVDMTLPTVFDRPVEVLDSAGYSCVTAPAGTRLVNCNAPNSNIVVDDQPTVRARVRTGVSLPRHVDLTYRLLSPRVFDPVPDNNVTTFRLERSGDTPPAEDEIFADRFE